MKVVLQLWFGGTRTGGRFILRCQHVTKDGERNPRGLVESHVSDLGSPQKATGLCYSQLVGW